VSEKQALLRAYKAKNTPPHQWAEVRERLLDMGVDLPARGKATRNPRRVAPPDSPLKKQVASAIRSLGIPEEEYDIHTDEWDRVEVMLPLDRYQPLAKRLGMGRVIGKPFTDSFDGRKWVEAEFNVYMGSLEESLRRGLKREAAKGKLLEAEGGEDPVFREMWRAHGGDEPTRNPPREVVLGHVVVHTKAGYTIPTYKKTFAEMKEVRKWLKAHVARERDAKTNPPKCRCKK
jgi:hypothetical protein